MKTLKDILVLSCCLALAACDLIDYHPYDANFHGRRDINAANIERIERDCTGRDSLRFAVISDTQRWYDETAKAVDHINARGDVDFVIHLGDLTDFSATVEFEKMRDELERLRPPYVCLIGNHDCLASGIYVFRAMFGEYNYSFTAGDTRFVCLDTNALEHDYSVPIPDFSFLKADIAAIPAGVRRTVVAMHAAPGTDQFNNNVSEIFHATLRAYPDLLFCLSGHQHSTQVYEPLGDGLTYYQCGAAKHRKYLLFTLTADGGSRYETVSY